MNFFSKPLNKVTFEDVLDFCSQKIKENQVLDYKKDWPKDLEKTISAFANTYGGLLIIGVDENRDNEKEDGTPVDKPEGLTFERGLEEKVTSIVLGRINPVVFPEVHVCKPVKGNTFVLIQISQSANTPHSVRDNTRVYLRTGNISHPEKEANIDERHWLSRNRESSKWLRDNTSNWVDGQFNVLCKHNKVTLNFGEVHMNIVPVYPDYLDIDLRKLKDEIVMKSVDTEGGSKFPYFSRSQINTMKGGLYLFNHARNELGEFTEFTAFHKIGLLTHIKDYGSFLKNQDNSDAKGLMLSSVVDEYYNFLRFYNVLRSELGVWGDYQVNVTLAKLEGVKIVTINHINRWADAAPEYLRGAHTYKGVLYQSDFADKESIIDEVADLAEDLLWSFNISSVKRDEIEQWLKSRYANLY